MQIVRAVACVALVLAILIAGRIAWEVVQFSSPPYACQVLGGSWSLFNGWSCL